MFDFDGGAEAKRRYAQLVQDADLYRAFFSTGQKRCPTTLVRRRHISSQICRAVTALVQCEWSQLSRLYRETDRHELSAEGSAALQAIEQTVRGNLGAARRMVDAVTSAPRDDAGGADVWAMGTAATALWAFATGETRENLDLPVLMERLLTLLPATAQKTRDFLCFSLALAAAALHEPALGSFLLGHKTHSIAASADSPESVGIATRAAFGFSIVAVGDASTGRRILLGVQNAPDHDNAPLLAGLVDSELVALQTAAGDVTSASHWLARTERFAALHGCRLLATRALSARGRSAIR